MFVAAYSDTEIELSGALAHAPAERLFHASHSGWIRLPLAVARHQEPLHCASSQQIERECRWLTVDTKQREMSAAGA